MRMLGTVVPLLLAATLIPACGEDSSSYYPLTKGLWWEYRLRVETARGNVDGRYLVTNLGKRLVHGEAAAVREVHDGSQYFYARRKDGVYRLGSRPGRAGSAPGAWSPHLVMPTPAVAGATWKAAASTSVLARPIGAYEKKVVNIVVRVPMVYRIEGTEAEVRVPAGHFGHCLRIHSRGHTTVDAGGVVGETEVMVENTDWYAPGIGLVKTVHRERTSSPRLPGGRFVMELNAVHRR